MFVDFLVPRNIYTTELIRSAGVRPSDRSGPTKSQESSTAAQPVDTVEISDEGRKASEQVRSTDPKEQDRESQPKGPDGEPLSEEQAQEVKELEKTDREVRTHEQAHLAAAGGYALGGVKFEFKTGPDNKRYAVAGHVSIDTSPESTPEKTLQKANTVRKAALAPAEPSSADRAVAAKATKMAQEARAQIAEENIQGEEEAEDDSVRIPQGYGKKWSGQATGRLSWVA